MTPMSLFVVYQFLIGSVQENDKGNLILVLMIVVFVIFKELMTTKFYFNDTYFKTGKKRRQLTEIKSIQAIYASHKNVNRGIGYLLIRLNSGEKLKISTRINEYQYNYFITLMNKKYKVGLD